MNMNIIDPEKFDQFAKAYGVKRHRWAIARRVAERAFVKSMEETRHWTGFGVQTMCRQEAYRAAEIAVRNWHAALSR